MTNPWHQSPLFSCHPEQAARNKAAREYAAWVQAARVADTSAELEVLKAEATTLLDRWGGRKGITAFLVVRPLCWQLMNLEF